MSLSLYSVELRTYITYTKPCGNESVAPAGEPVAIKRGTKLRPFCLVELAYCDPATPGENILFEEIEVDTPEEGALLVCGLWATCGSADETVN
jgi:hypothetical protein